MRRVVLLLCLAVLVNFPWAHEFWVAHQVDARGRAVVVTVTGTDVVEGRYFVRYRVPGSKTPYSARVGKASYDIARQGGELRGRAVPGEPGQNRVDGEIGGHGFAVLALVADAFLVIAALALGLRRRRTGYDVLGLSAEEEVVTIDALGRELLVRALPEVFARLRVGGRTYARLSLVAHTDLVPGHGQVGLEETGEPAVYRLCGRVVDVGPGWLDVAADDLIVRVRVGELRARADLRQIAEATGELWLA